LLEIEVLRTWMPPEETLQSVELKLEENLASSLFIDEAQREDARRDVVLRAIDAYWNAEHRHLWAERLFDTAFLLNADGRKDQANWALATAHALETQSSVATIPFCYAFFEQALRTDPKTGEVVSRESLVPVTASGLVLP